MRLKRRNSNEQGEMIATMAMRPVTGFAPPALIRSKKVGWFGASVALLLSVVLGLGVPFAAYYYSPSVHIDLVTPVFAITAAVLLANALFLALEGMLGSSRHRVPGSPNQPFTASAIVLAELPADEDGLSATIRSLLAQREVQDVVVVYGTTTLAGKIASLAADRRVRLLPVLPGLPIETKIEQGLKSAHGQVIGFFVSGQVTPVTGFSRAARWLFAGNDAVRGQRASSPGASWFSRIVAVGWASQPPLPDPSWGCWRGPNTYWRSDAALRMPNRPRIALDNGLLALEAAPSNLAGWWHNQLVEYRLWSSASFSQISAEFRRARLNASQSVRLFDRTTWQPTYVWLAAQVFPLIAYLAWKGNAASREWLYLIIVLAGLYLLNTGPMRTVNALAFSTGERPRLPYLRYLVTSSVLLTPLDHLAERAVQMEISLLPRRSRSGAGAAEHGPAPAAGEVPSCPSQPAIEPAPPQVPPSTPSQLAAPPPEPPIEPVHPISEDSDQGVKDMMEEYPTVEHPWTRDGDVQVASEVTMNHDETPAAAAAFLSTSSPSATANDVLTRSQEVVSLVRDLLQQIQGLEENRAAVAARVEGLEAEVAVQQAFRKALLAGPAASVDMGDLKALQGLADSLVQEPYHIGVLAQIGGHAGALATAMNGYAQIRSMLESDEQGPSSNRQA
ncbi:MAG: hypothetical protein ACRDFS_10140 [Chloroflexota bacterium]